MLLEKKWILFHLLCQPSLMLHDQQVLNYGKQTSPRSCDDVILVLYI